MALTRPAREAYHEAKYRRDHSGATSVRWLGRRDTDEVRIWLMAMALADEENITPWDALLLAVKRRAARVRWADGVAQSLIDQHRARCTETSDDYDAEYAATSDPDVPPATARTWLAESRNEERLMTRAAKMAVDAGVADAMIRRVERDGQLLVESLLSALDVLELTVDQRIKAIEALHAKISTTRLLGPGRDSRTIDQLPAGDGDDERDH